MPVVERMYPRESRAVIPASSHEVRKYEYSDDSKIYVHRSSADNPCSRLRNITKVDVPFVKYVVGFDIQLLFSVGPRKSCIDDAARTVVLQLSVNVGVDAGLVLEAVAQS